MNEGILKSAFLGDILGDPGGVGGMHTCLFMLIGTSDGGFVREKRRTQTVVEKRREHWIATVAPSTVFLPKISSMFGVRWRWWWRRRRRVGPAVAVVVVAEAAVTAVVVAVTAEAAVANNQAYVAKLSCQNLPKKRRTAPTDHPCVWVFRMVKEAIKHVPAGFAVKTCLAVPAAARGYFWQHRPANNGEQRRRRRTANNDSDDNGEQ